MPEVHLIGNAHLDPVWLWRWQEGCAEVMATFRSALDRLAQYDDFVFTCSSAAYYAWVEQIDPAMFEEIRRRVAEGRWVIAGGWWVQADCNLPAGESYARHALYSQRYFREKFGVTAQFGYCVDSFGHNAMLPQLLRQGGMKAYVYMRPGPHEMAYPFPDNTFLWTSPDGSSLPTFRISDSYCSYPGCGAVEEAVRVHGMAAQQGRVLMSFYGVGDHGGGPTIESIEALHALQGGQDGQDYRFSSPREYFAAIDPDTLPRYTGELQHHASGCYTAVMAVKAACRRSENRLVRAETADMMARLAGVKADAADLREAWLPTLFNQFHDVMCGCCVESAVRDALEGFGESLNAAARAENLALQRIAWNIDTSRGEPVVLSREDSFWWEEGDRGAPIVVFNPHSWPCRTPVTFDRDAAAVTAEDGTPLPVQAVRDEKTNGNDKYRTCFVAEVPALGWRTYRLHRRPAQTAPAVNGSLTVTPTLLENDFLRAELDEQGRLVKLTDKTQSSVLIAAPALPLALDDTANDTWAHGVDTFDQLLGAFMPAGARILEDGDVCAALRVDWAYGASTLTQTLRLYRGLPWLQLDCTVHWHERHRILKLAFDTGMADAVDTSSIPYGFLRRTADGKEQPMQKWMTVQRDGYGLGLATDTRTAYSCKNGEVRLTALRSPMYADHFGVRDADGVYTEQGVQSFTLALRAVNGDADRVALVRLGEELLAAPAVQQAAYRAGTLPPEAGLLTVSTDSVAVTALKAAENGSGTVLRAQELLGQPAHAAFTLGGTRFAADFRPQEIKSFRITENTVTPVDFLEDPV